MNTYNFPQLYSLAFGLSLLLGSFEQAHAACNNATNWIAAPGPEIKVFIGYKQEQQSGNLSFGVSQSATYDPYPDFLPKEMLGKEGNGTLSNEITSDISYYEPDGKGNWRVCRHERWWPPVAGDEASRTSLRLTTAQYAAKNPVLKKLGIRHMALHAVLYFYDSKGRITRVEQGDFMAPGSKAVIKACRQYDDEDNLTLLLDPKHSQSCQADPPDVHDEWLRYRYAKYDGKLVVLLDEWHTGRVQGGWIKEYGHFRTSAAPTAIFGAAKARSRRGVTVIYGSNVGKLDDNFANTVLNSFGQRSANAYFFTQGDTPLEVLDKPELIYKYERRRETMIDGVRLNELFKPNEHHSRYRYYLSNELVRHEQLDSNGRVRRVITVNDWRQPRPGPHPDVNDKLLQRQVWRLVGHQIYHRVYDLDATGIPTLVAVSWSRKASLNPWRVTHLDFAEVLYGTPDGKVRWASIEDFEKRFDFSSSSAPVFPDLRNGMEPEKI